MATSNEIPAPTTPLMAGCQQEPCSPSLTAPESHAKWEEYHGCPHRWFAFICAMERQRNEARAEARMLAMLASDTPQFFHPLAAIQAKALRDRILQENSVL